MKPLATRNPWWIVAAAATGLTVGNGPLIQYSFGAFLKPLAADLHADRATLSSAVLIGFAMAALVTPAIGHLVDRYGVRRIQLPAIVLFACAIAALGLSPASAYAFIALYGIAGAVSAGQSPLGYAKSVSGNFEHHRGLALGVAMSGVGLGAALIPQISQALIASVGWRVAYFGLGATIFIVAFPAVFAFLREPSLDPTIQRERPGLRVAEALRTRELWLLTYAFAALVAAGTGVFAHVVPILTDRGVSPQTAVSAISAAGIALIAGRLVAGLLLDRFFAPHVAQFFLLLPCCGVGLLYLSPTISGAVIATSLVGLGVGAEVDLMAYMVSRYFGMRAFGRVYSYMFTFFTLASGLGPFLMGLSFARTQSYGAAIIGFVISLLVASAFVFTLGAYRYPVEVQGRMKQSFA